MQQHRSDLSAAATPWQGPRRTPPTTPEHRGGEPPAAGSTAGALPPPAGAPPGYVLCDNVTNHPASQLRANASPFRPTQPSAALSRMPPPVTAPQWLGSQARWPRFDSKPGTSTRTPPATPPQRGVPPTAAATPPPVDDRQKPASTLLFDGRQFKQARKPTLTGAATALVAQPKLQGSSNRSSSSDSEAPVRQHGAASTAPTRTAGPLGGSESLLFGTGLMKSQRKRSTIPDESAATATSVATELATPPVNATDFPSVRTPHPRPAGRHSPATPTSPNGSVTGRDTLLASATSVCDEELSHQVVDEINRLLD